MEVTAYTDPDSFLRVVQEGLESREAENSLMLGAALSMRAAALHSVSPVLLTIGERGSWLLSALMTPPFPLVLASSREDGREALSPLAQRLNDLAMAVSGVVAAPILADAFADTWTREFGRERSGLVRQRIYRITEVREVAPVSGQLRRATALDADLVAQWFAEFEAEALNAHDGEAAALGARQRIARGEIYLWEDAEPRAMAARARPTRNSISVNAVYTPPPWRRRGFATATVAELSRQLLNEGYSMCVLYTDLANPTSNNIYRSIGYEVVCDSHHVAFEG